MRYHVVARSPHFVMRNRHGDWPRRDDVAVDDVLDRHAKPAAVVTGRCDVFNANRIDAVVDDRFVHVRLLENGGFAVVGILSVVAHRSRTHVAVLSPSSSSATSAGVSIGFISETVPIVRRSRRQLFCAICDLRLGAGTSSNVIAPSADYVGGMRVFDINLVNAIQLEEGFSIDSTEIVEAIERGESVFLTNGSKVIAAVTPVDDVTERRVSPAVAANGQNDS